MPQSWYPGLNATGAKPIAEPAIFASPTPPSFMHGIATIAPTVTAPGTVVSAGTVVNATGVDCLVYLGSTTGIQSIIVTPPAGTLTAAGTVPANQLVPVWVAANQSIIVTYTGTLTWRWLGI